jgi:hypothetical protein
MTESAKTESSLLTQRLQRRLVDLPGVIDTQNPHRHYGAIQTTSDRLIQRLALPETIASRYQIASLQPTVIAQRSHYQRVELRGGESSSLTWRVQRLPASETDTQFINQVKVVASPPDTTGLLFPLSYKGKSCKRKWQDLQKNHLSRLILVLIYHPASFALVGNLL